MQGFSDLFVIRSDENGSLFDGYCDAVEQWQVSMFDQNRFDLLTSYRMFQHCGLFVL